MNQYNKQDPILELFGMLKSSVDKDIEATDKLINQQFELVTQLKTLPIADIKQMLKEHADKSEKEIDECSGTIELKTGEIMEKLKEIIAKINKAFWVIAIVAGLMATAYFVVRSSYDNENVFKKWQKEITDQQNKEHEELVDSITEKIREEMRRLHDEDDQGDTNLP